MSINASGVRSGTFAINDMATLSVHDTSLMVIDPGDGVSVRVDSTADGRQRIILHRDPVDVLPHLADVMNRVRDLVAPAGMDSVHELQLSLVKILTTDPDAKVWLNDGTPNPTTTDMRDHGEGPTVAVVYYSSHEIPVKGIITAQGKVRVHRGLRGAADGPADPQARQKEPTSDPPRASRPPTGE